MTRPALWSLAIALSGALWVAIVELLGWWVAGVLVYVALLGLAAVVSVGGFNALGLWFERRRRGADPG